MSREGIQKELLERNISVYTLIYGQSDVSVYQGSCGSSPAAIKVLYANSLRDYQRAEAESTFMLRLSHPNVVKLYDFFWLKKGDATFVVIVSEWCAKDLAKDTEQRKKGQFPWTEWDLWNLLRSLVSCLAYMQSLNTAHRDLKPANLFLVKDTVKVGDFGSAVFRSSYANYQSTVTGTFQYFSPLLREAFARNQFAVVHNAYKSDVFSLGLTMLHLALLDYPHVFHSFQRSRNEIWSAIDCINYAEGFKRTVMWMLEPEECHRCDFKELDDYLNLSNVPPELQEILESTAEEEKDAEIRQHTKTISDMEDTLPSPTCLKCGKAIARLTADRKKDIVRLPCQPDHLYCSTSCFMVFAYSSEKRHLKCPACGTDINRETWKQYIKTTEASVRSSRAHALEHTLQVSKASVKHSERRLAITSGKTCGGCSVM